METGVHVENHQTAASHGQTLLYLPCITTKGIVIIGFLVVRRRIGCVMASVGPSVNTFILPDLRGVFTLRETTDKSKKLYIKMP